MTKLRRPPRIRAGDTIGVAALSGPPNAEQLAAGCALLEEFGYRVRRGRNLGVKGGLLGLAGDDAERLGAYRELLLDPDVKAIVFARGGYGIGRILPMLDVDEIGATPKIHCGFSDITALAGFLLTRCGIPSFHGPMVAADLPRERDAISASFFPSMLEGRGPYGLDLPDADVLVPGSASGRLIGGCLSMLVAMVGSPEELDLDGAILFFEDIAEEAYRIDRMLGTLLRAGRFDKLRGILVGALTGITFGGAEDPRRLRDVLAERLAPLGVPVVMGLPCGHRGPNATLPVGARVTWDGAARFLRFEEEIVS